MCHMTLDELKNIIACGEDSSHQFKRDFSNAESLAAELIAFANTIGGMLIIGVEDTGCITLQACPHSVWAVSTSCYQT